jgi:hypothetical protein
LLQNSSLDNPLFLFTYRIYPAHLGNGTGVAISNMRPLADGRDKGGKEDNDKRDFNGF